MTDDAEIGATIRLHLAYTCRFMIRLSCKPTNACATCDLDLWPWPLTFWPNAPRAGITKNLQLKIVLFEAKKCLHVNDVVNGSIMQLLSKQLPRGLHQHYYLSCLCVYLRCQIFSFQAHKEWKPDIDWWRHCASYWTVSRGPQTDGLQNISVEVNKPLLISHRAEAIRSLELNRNERTPASTSSTLEFAFRHLSH